MLGWGPATRIYLAAGATDMRKGFEGLYALVRDRLELEPLSGLRHLREITHLHSPKLTHSICN
jgi:transposase